MGLTIRFGFAGRTRSNCGEGASPARAGRHLRTASLTFASLPLLLFSIAPANAQQTNQPGFDPRQTERRFDAIESGQRQPARPGLRMPQLARPAVAADTRPQFNLRDIVLTGAVAIPRAELTRTYQRYLGNRVLPGRPRRHCGCDQRPLSSGRLSAEPGDRPASGHLGWQGSDPGD